MQKLRYEKVINEIKFHTKIFRKFCLSLDMQILSSISLISSIILEKNLITSRDNQYFHSKSAIPEKPLLFKETRPIIFSTNKKLII